MLFDPYAPLINRDTGRPAVEKDVDAERVVTHGVVVRRALDSKLEDDRGKDADVFKRFLLGTRIAGAAEGETIDITIDEAKWIKDAVAKVFPVGVWGQIWAALDDAARARPNQPNGHAASAGRAMA